jgi:hypothetical protein
MYASTLLGFGMGLMFAREDSDYIS